MITITFPELNPPAQREWERIVGLDPLHGVYRTLAEEIVDRFFLEGVEVRGYSVATRGRMKFSVASDDYEALHDIVARAQRDAVLPMLTRLVTDLIDELKPA